MAWHQKYSLKDTSHLGDHFAAFTDALEILFSNLVWITFQAKLRGEIPQHVGGGDGAQPVRNICLAYYDVVQALVSIKLPSPNAGTFMLHPRGRHNSAPVSAHMQHLFFSGYNLIFCVSINPL